MIHKAASFSQENGATDAIEFFEGLSKTVQDHIHLSDSRMATLSWLTLCFLRVGTVYIGRLAAYVESRALEMSVLRRFERFFQHVQPGLEGAVAQIIVGCCDLTDTVGELSLIAPTGILAKPRSTS